MGSVISNIFGGGSAPAPAAPPTPAPAAMPATVANANTKFGGANPNVRGMPANQGVVSSPLGASNTLLGG